MAKMEKLSKLLNNTYQNLFLFFFINLLTSSKIQTNESGLELQK